MRSTWRASVERLPPVPLGVRLDDEKKSCNLRFSTWKRLRWIWLRWTLAAFSIMSQLCLLLVQCFCWFCTAYHYRPWLFWLFSCRTTRCLQNADAVDDWAIQSPDLNNAKQLQGGSDKGLNDDRWAMPNTLGKDIHETTAALSSKIPLMSPLWEKRRKSWHRKSMQYMETLICGLEASASHTWPTFIWCCLAVQRQVQKRLKEDLAITHRDSLYEVWGEALFRK